MDFDAIERLTGSQVEDLCRLYQAEWWTRGRRIEDVRKSLEAGGLVIGFQERESCRLVAFARVLTDKVYKALVLDVIVEPELRGRGLGKRLMARIVEHPELAGVEHFELYCNPELIPFYEAQGFTTDLGSLRFMRLSR